MTLKLDDAFPSNYIRAADLGKQSHRLTIDNIEIETLGQGPDADEKPVVQFRGRKKRWVLNKTNALEIAATYGNDMADWFGRDVEIFSQLVQGPQGMTDGIRCRVPADEAKQNDDRTVAAEPRSNGPGADFDDDIPF